MTFLSASCPLGLTLFTSLCHSSPVARDRAVSHTWTRRCARHSGVVRRTEPGISKSRFASSRRPGMTASRRQGLHFPVAIRLALQADARQFRHDDVAGLHADAVGEAAIGLEQIRIALIAAKAEAGGDVERHLVTAMRDAAARRPAMRVQDFERALVFAEP